jgi:hypothetical protein
LKRRVVAFRYPDMTLPSAGVDEHPNLWQSREDCLPTKTRVGAWLNVVADIRSPQITGFGHSVTQMGSADPSQVRGDGQGQR